MARIGDYDVLAGGRNQSGQNCGAFGVLRQEVGRRAARIVACGAPGRNPGHLDRNRGAVGGLHQVRSELAAVVVESVESQRLHHLFRRVVRHLRR